MAERIPGIDVAKYQGEPDWNAVRGAGYVFAYIKATEGVGYVSPTLDAQLGGARRAGMVTGLYHFARPDTNGPEDEAATFAEQLGRLDSAGQGNLPPCLDMETESSNFEAWIKAFIDSLRGRVGRHELTVYASSSWFSEKLNPQAWADPGVYFWVAHYGRKPGEPAFNGNNVVIHQHASDGQVPGVDGETDLNVSMVPLQELTGAAPPPPPSERTHVVQPGETLSGIAGQYELDWRDIARANGVSDPDLIYVGQVLRIP